VLVHDDRDRGPGRTDLPGQGDGLVELGPGDRAGGDLLGEDPGDARGLSASPPGCRATGGRWRRGRTRFAHAPPARCRPPQGGAARSRPSPARAAAGPGR
jgi:hypothetical protein